MSNSSRSRTTEQQQGPHGHPLVLRTRTKRKRTSDHNHPNPRSARHVQQRHHRCCGLSVVSSGCLADEAAGLTAADNTGSVHLPESRIISVLMSTVTDIWLLLYRMAADQQHCPPNSAPICRCCLQPCCHLRPRCCCRSCSSNSSTWMRCPAPRCTRRATCTGTQ